MKNGVISVAAAVALSTGTAHAADGPVVAYFPASIDAVAAVTDICIRKNIMIVEQDDRHVVCSQEVSGLKGALTQMLIGNSYSTTPTLSVRFSLSKTHDYTAVQATQWVETQMAFGQVRRSNLDGKKNNANLRNILLSAGAYTTPPRVSVGSEAPPKAAAPLVSEPATGAAEVPSKPASAPAAAAPERQAPRFGNSRVRCITC